MKLAVRVSAFIFVVAAAVAGSSVSRNTTVVAAGSSAVTSGTPIPTCNPFTDKCPNIR